MYDEMNKKQHLLIVTLITLLIVFSFIFIKGRNNSINDLLKCYISGLISFATAYIVFYLGSEKERNKEKREWILNQRPYFNINEGLNNEVNIIFYNKGESIIYDTDVYVFKKCKNKQYPLPEDVKKNSTGHHEANTQFNVKKNILAYDLLIKARTIANEDVYFYYGGNGSYNDLYYKENEKLNNKGLDIYCFVSINKDEYIEKLIKLCKKL
jgi:hypothetical protein